MSSGESDFPYYYSASNHVSKWVSKEVGNQSKLSFFCHQLPQLHAEHNYVSKVVNITTKWSVKSIFISLASSAYLHAIKMVEQPSTWIVLRKKIRMFDVNHSSWVNAKTFFTSHRKNCFALLFLSLSNNLESLPLHRLFRASSSQKRCSTRFDRHSHEKLENHWVPHNRTQQPLSVEVDDPISVMRDAK